MTNADHLIEQIVRASRLANSGRRQDVGRELRAHLEDFAEAARGQGRTDTEIQALIRERFGDPAEIAEGFAWVYRRDRALRQTWAFALAILAAAAAGAAILFPLQVAFRAGIGADAPAMMGVEHLTLESIYLLGTMGAYLGIVSLERRFRLHALEKSVAAILAIFAVLGAALALTVGHAAVMLMAFASGVAVRLAEVCCRRAGTRAFAVIAAFAAAGLLASLRLPLALSPPAVSLLLLRLAVWIAIGLSSQCMTGLALRVDRALLRGMST
jgi:hypothetical protein